MFNKTHLKTFKRDTYDFFTMLDFVDSRTTHLNELPLLDRFERPDSEEDYR